jgi:hypothetical protein
MPKNEPVLSVFLQSVGGGEILRFWGCRPLARPRLEAKSICRKSRQIGSSFTSTLR